MTETDQTRTAFDAAAPTYDALYENLPGIRRIRTVTARCYKTYFPPGSRLLEINCGTGNDAVSLAKHGCSILATDISPRMLDAVREKVSASRLNVLVEPRLLAFDQLSGLRGDSFDGAYSNLGGLNCTDDLRSLAGDLAELLKPGGYFIATVMPPFCLWETAAFLIRARWKSAFRRSSREGALARLHGQTFRTYYYSPRQFATAFSEWFDHVATEGLAVFLPPPNFDGLYRRLGAGVRTLLERMDDRLARLPLLRSIGDHYLIVMRRKGPADLPMPHMARMVMRTSRTTRG